MQAWALLQIMFSLALIASCLALIIAKLHIIDRREEQKFWEQVKERIAGEQNAWEQTKNAIENLK